MTIKSKYVLDLIKTHLTYISFLILAVGFTLKYSVPSIFPSLIRFDIRYFGDLFINFGFVFLIGNFLLDRYKEDVNTILFSKILDKKIGLKNDSLLIELQNLINPFSYNLTSYFIENHIVNRGNKLYDIEQIIKIRLHPKRDNVHYIFGGGSSKNKLKIHYVKLNGKSLILKDDIRSINTPYVQSFTVQGYQIITPLKKDIDYDIEIKLSYPDCMSDLNDGSECDFQETAYYALTERTLIKCHYEFDNFDEYEFKAVKKYLTLPDIVELDVQTNIENKCITVESGNLKNGDRICLTYTKKKK